MVTDGGPVTHVGSSEVSVTSRPPAGAEIGLPWLSSRMSMSCGKVSGTASADTVTLRSAVTEALVTDAPNCGLETVTSVVPGATPWSVALPARAPSGMNTVELVGVVISGSVGVTVTVRPPG